MMRGLVDALVVRLYLQVPRGVEVSADNRELKEGQPWGKFLCPILRFV